MAEVSVEYRETAERISHNVANKVLPMAKCQKAY